MTHDTTRDPRLLVAQRACALLKKHTRLKLGVPLKPSKEEFARLTSAVESAVMTLAYLYQPPPQLTASEPMNDLIRTVRTLADGLAPALSSTQTQALARANLAWSLRTLQGLPARLANPGTTLASGVDLVTVQVRNTVRSPALTRTQVHDGQANYTVVTNLPGIETGDKLAAAFLPPREVGDAVSEAMFLGPRKRPEPPGTHLTENQVDAREAAGILYEEISKH